MDLHHFLIYSMSIRTQSMLKRSILGKSSNNDVQKHHRSHQRSRDYMKAELRKRDATKLFRYYAMKRSIKWYVIFLVTVNILSYRVTYLN